jgi:hypothetical protein
MKYQTTRPRDTKGLIYQYECKKIHVSLITTCTLFPINFLFKLRLFSANTIWILWHVNVTSLWPLRQETSVPRNQTYFTSIYISVLYSASHSRVAPENVGLQKEQKFSTFSFHTCNEVRLCVLGIR